MAVATSPRELWWAAAGSAIHILLEFLSASAAGLRRRLPGMLRGAPCRAKRGLGGGTPAYGRRSRRRVGEVMAAALVEHGRRFDVSLCGARFGAPATLPQKETKNVEK